MLTSLVSNDKLKETQSPSAYRALKNRSLYLSTSSSSFGRSINVSQRSILPLYKCPSNKIYQFVFPDNEFCTPFHCDFSHQSQEGNLLAIGDEEGRLSLIRSDKNNDVHNISYHHSFYCHTHAITDVKWSKDDTMLVTAANDRMVRLWDTEFETSIAEFSGHEDVVKSVNWHPTNEHLIITGSKDGTFKIWDTRFNQKPAPDPDDTTRIPVYNPIKSVNDAHVLKSKTKMTRKAGPKPLLIRSVTCAIFLNREEEKVITSGSADGSIKLWDIRAGRLSKEVASTVFANEKGKLHGITDMKIDNAGTRLFSCCMDNSIYMHYLTDLTKPAVRYSDPSYKVGSFDIRLSISYDDQFLLSGSFEKDIFAWEINHPKSKAQVYEGHTSKVTSVCWSKNSINQFASCSEDFTSRIWNITI